MRKTCRVTNAWILSRAQAFVLAVLRLGGADVTTQILQLYRAANSTNPNASIGENGIHFPDNTGPGVLLMIPLSRIYTSLQKV